MKSKPTMDEMKLALSRDESEKNRQRYLKDSVVKTGKKRMAKGVLSQVEADENLNRYAKRSVLKEDSGKPMRLYHQTKNDFSEFIPGGMNPKVSGPAIWLKPDPRKMMSGHNTGTSRSGIFPSGTVDMPLYAKLENALGSNDKNWKEVYGQFKNKGNSPWIMTLEFVDELKRLGYDGIMHFDTKGEMQEAAVFHPTQVKSAIGNRGTYDPNDPDITKASGGLACMADGGEVQSDAELRTDVPNEDWLRGEVKYAKQKGRDRFGVPYMGKVTGSFNRNMKLPVNLLASLKGMRGEQENVRHEDLAWLKNHMKKTGKLPLTKAGEEYAPYVMVSHNGEPWVSEGNHRIMAAKELGMSHLPVEVRYFDGGERAEGKFHPDKLKEHDAKYSVQHKASGGSVPSQAVMMSKGGRTPLYSALDKVVPSLPNKALPDQYIKELLKAGVKPQEIIDRRLGELIGAPIQQKIRTVIPKGKEPIQEKYFDVMPSAKGAKSIGRETVENAVMGNPAPKVSTRVLKGARAKEDQYSMEYDDASERWVVSDQWGIPKKSFDDDQDAEFYLAKINGGEARYEDSNYMVPGGENYREILLKFPSGYQSPHFGEEGKDYLAHARVTDRTDATGKKVLHVEEIQSDLHQKGRKSGYKQTDLDKQIDALQGQRDIEQSLPNRMRLTEKIQELEGMRDRGVPDAPFKNNWHELVLRHLLDEAVKKGYDKLFITPGDEQVERYELEGKEAEGKRKIYDEIIPNFLNRYGKKWGAKVSRDVIHKPDYDIVKGNVEKAYGEGTPAYTQALKNMTVPMHSFEITPQMKEAIKVSGQTLYKSGGVAKYAGGGNIQGGSMPTLSEMKLALSRRNNPIELQSVGINEALGYTPKPYIPPEPVRSFQPAPGGVAMSSGMPIGGIDQSRMQPGQQLMPSGALPQGNMPGQQPNPMPAGMGDQPAGQSNILSLTPQGRALGALGGPPGQQPQAMATGGSAKNYTHEVYRRQTGEVKGQYQSVEAARRARDRYDNQYGAYVHGVRLISDSRAGKTASSSLELLAGGGGVKSQGITMGAPKQTRMVFQAQGPGGVTGINVPRHMWEGGAKSSGMKDVNAMRAKVYGKENRDPLTIGQIGRIHKDTLAEHFAKPLDEQVKAEKDALGRLREAGHISKGANTLDESEKLDTVRHEHDEEGRTHVGFASKGVAGHALYTSGHGENKTHHVINTCPGQTAGCGGGKDEKGIVDTSKGTCFAPVAEAQYPGASVRRACHAQAKHDPAMTRDWILAHAGSLRNAAKNADKNDQRLLFRPNVVDETDVSSRHVIEHLNKQRESEGRPPIVANSYGKTNELHDPENGYYVTHSNIGPKVKKGQSVSENISRDKQRIRSTITATTAAGNDFVNEQGNATPPKGSYMVTDVKRGSDMDKKMQKAIKYAKYWSQGRKESELTAEEKEEGPEGHYGPDGKSATPDKAHYGHTTVNGRRYDYQKQHILHPRLVQVGKNDDGTPHMIPTDSRFKDEEYLPKNRFKTKNGKKAGAILMTTPTTSTSNVGHQTSFTHHVNEDHIKHAQKNRGEYEIDPPHEQETAMGKEYVAPQPIKMLAGGGHVAFHHAADREDHSAYPEQSFAGQLHNTHRDYDNDYENSHHLEHHREKLKERMMSGKYTHKRPVTVHKNTDTMRYEMTMRRKG